MDLLLNLLCRARVLRQWVLAFRQSAPVLLQYELRRLGRRVRHAQPGRVIERVVEDDRVPDADVLVRAALAVGIRARDLPHHVHPLRHFAEERVALVKVRLLLAYSDEELGAVAVRLRRGHGDASRFRVP